MIDIMTKCFVKRENAGFYFQLMNMRSLIAQAIKVSMWRKVEIKDKF